MSDITFAVSPQVRMGQRLEPLDYVGSLRASLRRNIEATWLPRNPLVACDKDHALLTALQLAFNLHFPLRLTPDVIWITLARGFALHVNLHAEGLRHRFVAHEGKRQLVVARDEFVAGADNPWTEVFAEFNAQLATETGGMGELVQAEFSTTGPTERAISYLMAMETFSAFFEYLFLGKCGIPSITLAGTERDWQLLRRKAHRFADYGLEKWIEALDPILIQFERAKAGTPDVEFWQSMFRYQSSSIGTAMSGWASVFFPYFQDEEGQLYRNPYLQEWQQRLAVFDSLNRRDRLGEPNGVSIKNVPGSFTSVPLKARLGEGSHELRLLGGLMGVTQAIDTLTLEPECGWAVIYDEPVLDWSEVEPPPRKIKRPVNRAE